MTKVLLVSAIAASAFVAQQQQPTFRASTVVVAIDVSVMDGKKGPVTTLTKEDFRLTDAGVEQSLMDVGREQLPLDITLTIDVSGSVTPEKRATIQRAIKQVTDTLRPEDRCSVVSFDARISENAPLTHPPANLEIGKGVIGGTSFVDALLLSMVTAPAIDRRQLNLFLTDGVDTTSFFKTTLVLENMKFATGQTSVILVEGKGSNLGDGAVRDLLKTVTATSGGQIVTLDKNDELKDTFLTALNEFRTSYQLRYSPTGTARPGWHPVVVTVPKGKYTIRARQGYWSGS